MTAYDRSGPDRSEPPVVTGREVPKTTVNGLLVIGFQGAHFDEYTNAHSRNVKRRPELPE